MWPHDTNVPPVAPSVCRAVNTTLQTIVVDTWSPKCSFVTQKPIVRCSACGGSDTQGEGNWQRAILYLKWRFDCNLYRDEWQLNDGCKPGGDAGADGQLPHQVSPDPTEAPSVRQNRIFEQTGNKTFNSQPTNLFLIMNMKIQTEYTRGSRQSRPVKIHLTKNIP